MHFKLRGNECGSMDGTFAFCIILDDIKSIQRENKYKNNIVQKRNIIVIEW